MRTSWRLRVALAIGICALLSACGLSPSRPQALQGSGTPAAGATPERQPPAPPASESPPPEQIQQGAAIASAATALIGSPYHFGGADEGGFDCSGLALFAHERVGIGIPRTAAEQQHAARPVPISQILPGDLVFFRIRKRGVDHVGVYVGDGRFVHAPRAGVAVSAADLSGEYYARHIVGAGRFWRQNAPPR